MVPLSTRINRLLVLLSMLLIALLVIRLVVVRHTIHTTGILQVVTDEPDADITVTQPNHTAMLLGKGRVQVRLKPGLYQVAAKLSGTQSLATVRIANQRMATVTLNPAHAQLLPSVADTNFINFDTLSTHGLTNDQVVNTESLFRVFQPKAQDIVIDTASITNAPFDPGSGEPLVLVFNVSIDSNTYTANLSFTGDEYVQLVLKDAMGNQVYSGFQSSAPGS